MSIADIEWRLIPGFTDYEVSNTGLVRSNKRRKPYVLRTGSHPQGYRQVGLRKNGKTHVLKVGYLVLLAFKGPCPKNCEMCHNDGDPTNDYVENLRWDTHAANMRDAARHGTMGRPRIPRPPTKKEILANEVKAMRVKMIDSISLGQRIKVLRVMRDMKQTELAERVGLTTPSLSCIENDHSIPRPKRFIAIMNELGWSEQVEKALAILVGDT